MDRPLIINRTKPRVGETRTTVIEPRRDERPVRAARNVGTIILVIVLIIIILVLLVLVIVFALRKAKTNTIINTKCSTDANCTDGKKCFGGSCVQCSSDSDCSNGLSCLNTVCTTCSTPPRIPTNVHVAYDSTTSTATVSWDPSPAALSYNIYRKANDAGVGVNNYDEKKSTIGNNSTSVNFSGYNQNNSNNVSNYFVVTSVNGCGESPTSPPVSSASCTNVLAKPAPPTIVPTANICFNVQQSQIISETFPDQTLTNGAYVLRGNNQYGAVDNYHYIVMQSSYGPATGIAQKCNGQTSDHTLTLIRNTQAATVTTPNAIPNSDTTKTLTWTAVAGAEAYTYWLVGQEALTNNLRFYGGYTNGNVTTVTFPVNANDTFVVAMVLGYKYCDISSPSDPAHYTSP